MFLSQFRHEKLPLRFDKERYPRTDYLLINLAARIAWLVRLASPAAWILSLFQYQPDKNRPFYTRARATELYQLAVVLIPMLIYFACSLATNIACAPILAILCVTLGLETIQYQFWSVILRPALQPDYKVYSATRTLLLLLLQYVQIIFIYSSVYLIWFADFFGANRLGGRAALEFSMLTMTTVSFGTIVPTAGSPAALVAATQAMIGIFFLGLMVATTLSRIRGVKEIEKNGA